MKTVKKTIALILAFVFSAMLAVAMPVSVLAEATSVAANRYNVVLVIDKSGSLRDGNGSGTDPEGLRFDAMKLFLGLLTETGNHVGVVAFDDEIRFDSGLRIVDSLDEKKELVSAVEALGTSYDTDIGGAVLRAAELLHGMREENGLPCVILLLTDGMTDFPAGDAHWLRMIHSREAAEKALQAARDEGITIHGILLNVEDRAASGIPELRAFTDGTDGQFEMVSSPEDLTAAFSRFYSIINQTEYTGAHKVVFSALGEAETGFLVPDFGTEEVNIIIEHASNENSGVFNGVEEIHIIRPDGAEYGAQPHMLSTSRFLLIKIPDPMSGAWNVKLKGNPGDSIDICQIYNASLSVGLSADNQEASILEPVSFSAVLTDNGTGISQEQLDSIEISLKVKDLSTGEVQDYPLNETDGVCTWDITFDDGGDYSIAAQASLGDLEVRSNALKLSVEVPPPVAKRDGISSLTELGSVRDGVWELDLNTIFEDPKGTALTYSLSDDCGGAATIGDDGILRVKLTELDAASFTVTATDAYGLSAQLPVAFSVERLIPMFSRVDDMLESGSFTGDLWEIDLNSLFKGEGLSYSLSDDLDGAVTIEDGKLRVKLTGIENASFTVTATDANGLRAEIPFTLRVPEPEVQIEGVSSLSDVGSVHDGVWELDLNTLFKDPKGSALTYSLSDDLGGAVTIDEDGLLRTDLAELEEVNFTVTATDALGMSAELPVAFRVERYTPRLSRVDNMLENGSFRGDLWEFDLNSLFEDAAGLSYTLSDDLNGALTIEDGKLLAKLTGIENAAFTVTATDANGLRVDIPFRLSIPAPEALVSGISETVKTDWFHDGSWELALGDLFRDPKGSELAYSLSEDFGGALKLDGDTLQAKCRGIGKADFVITATDPYGLSAELPVSLVENDITWIYIVLIVLVVLGIGAGVFFRRRQTASSAARKNQA